ncbi:MAG: peroxiredoxin [Candidatus Micrarchaeota archaeon]|nr:peroxiredoxin [Candidatus Micrarchaeota archaeon]
MIKEGSRAPAFALKGADGKTYRLSDFKGRTVVLYFYPKDDTPGCTIEAKGFNESLEGFRRKNAEVIGISKDGTDSHRKFCDKYSLNFLLLSDPESKTIKEYGAYGDKGVFGMGTLRKTYIIGRDGKIIRIFGRVKPLGHEKEVLSALPG